ncbi:MAG: endonuclease Q family protein [bacterium]|nr:endonuclease Q family protein [bacterium]
MKFIGDFHIHSKYARATSQDMNLENLAIWAKKKGIQVMSTGDFTHPAWFQELRSKLEPSAPGLFKLKNNTSGTSFILTTEISCIYSKNGKVRKVHLLVFAPSLEAVKKINDRLALRGNLAADGRPIIGIDAIDVVKIALDASPECMVIPAHAWTPWFAVFGSKSGFDSLEECFDDYAKYIYAVETGLSSDPAMNWRFSKLDNVALISNSDSHSLQKIGREANVFDTEVSYQGIADAIKTRDPKKFLFTVEFFPEEGKYHYDGHRLCHVSLAPAQSKERNGICPKCGKPLTIGVLNRVEELADRPEGFVPPNNIPFKSLVPLDEIIGEALHVGVHSKQVLKEYEGLLGKIGSEFKILLDTSLSDLQEATLPEIAHAISCVREGKIRIEPGYDGEYGKIALPSAEKEAPFTPQRNLL